MPPKSLLDYIPLWGIFCVTVILITVSMELGFRLGKRRRARGGSEKEAPVTAIVGALLGLLGFMLAITFNVAVSRFEMRMGAYLKEVDAISTAYLRADFFPFEAREQIQGYLREYLNVRIHAVDSGEIQEGIVRSEEIHQQLWSVASSLVKANETSLPFNLFIQSLNEIIDVHSRRVFAGLWLRIPLAIWLVLYATTACGMGALGYQTALSGSSRTPASAALIIAFAAILWLITDLDRPAEGLLRINQQTMRNMVNSRP